ncbi:MAG: hypothetical protein R6V83_09890 [Candidatus Thorarchaeota archaeon]
MKLASVYVIRNNGELAYSRVLSDERNNLHFSLPTCVKTGVTLLSSAASVSEERTYFLQDNGNFWVYALFNEFAVVAVTSETENKAQLKQRLVSLGKAIRKSYGNMIDTWAGEIPQMADLDNLVDRYLLVKPEPLQERVVDCARQVADKALEAYKIAYVGVFDAEGNMVYGNVPESHTQRIQEEISKTGFKPTPDMVPSSLKVNKYDVQFFKGRSYSVVAASYRGGRKMEAVHAVDEIMQALRDVSAS